MAHSPELESFNPFATHPFTNGCGVLPQPPMPSMYPIPIPSLNQHTRHSGGLSQYPALSTSASSISSSSSTESSTPLRSPQPRRVPLSMSPSKISASPRQIYVPSRKYTSSPDLVLKKKSPSQNVDASQRAK